MKKIFTLIAVACLSAINAMAAITKAPDAEYTSIAELEGKTFAIVNKAEGKAYYGTNAQNLGYDVYEKAFVDSNSGYMWKIVKDDEMDAYFLQLVTPAGTDYNCWNMGGVLNSQGEPQGWACSFILGKANQKGQDIPNGALYELNYTENGWTIKNVGTGMYTKYSTGPANSEEPTYWTFCSLKEEGEADPEPEPVDALASLQSLIDNGNIFLLKSGDVYLYGSTNQNIAFGDAATAIAATNMVNGYKFEYTTVGGYYHFVCLNEGNNVTIYGANPCYINAQPNANGVIFNLRKDQDGVKGSSFYVEEVEGGYTIQNAANGAYVGTSTALSAEPVVFTIELVSKIKLSMLIAEAQTKTQTDALADAIASATNLIDTPTATDEQFAAEYEALKDAINAAETAINTVSTVNVKVGKFMENGQIVIVKNGQKFNVAGQAK